MSKRKQLIRTWFVLFVSLFLGASAQNNLDLPEVRAFEKEVQLGQWGQVDSVLLQQSDKILYRRRFGRGELPNSKLPGDDNPYNYEDPSWHPYYKDTNLHTTQSVTKAVLATLVANAIFTGDLTDLDETIDLEFQGPFRPGTTVRHLLDMTAGLEWDEESDYGTPGNDWTDLERSYSWLQFVLQKSSIEEPGSKFCYNSGLPQVLASLLERRTGKDLEKLAQERLFSPLGIKDWQWKRSLSGEIDAQGGLYLSDESLAKLGQLYLQDGVWNGKRILPEAWLSRVLNSSVQAYPGLSYSKAWWLNESEDTRSLVAIGYRGQRLYVLPEQNMVFVFYAWNRTPNEAPSTSKVLKRLLKLVP